MAEAIIPREGGINNIISSFEETQRKYNESRKPLDSFSTELWKASYPSMAKEIGKYTQSDSHTQYIVRRTAQHIIDEFDNHPDWNVAVQDLIGAAIIGISEEIEFESQEYAKEKFPYINSISLYTERLPHQRNARRELIGNLVNDYKEKAETLSELGNLTQDFNSIAASIREFEDDYVENVLSLIENAYDVSASYFANGGEQKYISGERAKENQENQMNHMMFDMIAANAENILEVIEPRKEGKPRNPYSIDLGKENDECGVIMLYSNDLQGNNKVTETLYIKGKRAKNVTYSLARELEESQKTGWKKLMYVDLEGMDSYEAKEGFSKTELEEYTDTTKSEKNLGTKVSSLIPSAKSIIASTQGVTPKEVKMDSISFGNYKVSETKTPIFENNSLEQKDVYALSYLQSVDF